MKVVLKSKIFFLISIFALYFVLGCSNSISDPQDVAPAETSNGVIKIALGLDEKKVVSSSARSAVPSSFLDSSGNQLVFAASVTSDATPSDSDLVSVTLGASNTLEVPFEFSSTARPNYHLNIYAFPNGTTTFTTTSALLHGSATIDIPANVSSINFPETVQMLPNEGTATLGIVNLSIEIPDGYTLTCDDTTNFSYTGSGTAYTFTNLDAQGIAPNSYTVTFTISKGSSAVYAWTEIIYVYPGLTTDRWNTGEVSDASTRTTRLITTATLYSTFYVRGTGSDWFGLEIPNGSDTEGTGSLAKPYATVQKAVERVIALNGGADGEAYTIFVGGTVKDSNITLDGKVNLLIQGLTASYDDNIIKSSNSGEYIFSITTGANVTFKNLSITGANVTDGTMYGGAISAGENTNIVFDNVHAYTNKAAYGGVIYTDGNVTLQNGTVFGDKTKTTTATSSSYSNYATYNSGAIRVGGGTLTIKSDCYVAYNYVTGDGGGITVQGAGIVIIEKGAFIQYNAITGNGGGINFGNTNNTATISGNIIGNSASLTGGGIYIGGGTVTIKDGEISNNSASGNGGGGVYVNGGTFEMTDGTISRNSATSYGGAIYIQSDAVVTMNGGTISNNKTVLYDGGGVYAHGTFTMSGGEISGNTATQHGGGIYVTSSGTFTMSGGTIGGDATGSGNMASGSGGGVYAHGTFAMNGGEISGNTATQHGGGIYNNGTFNISGAAYIPVGNDSKNDVYLPNGKSIKITGNLSATLVAKITPESYDSNQVVLKGESAALLTANILKFDLLSDYYVITQDPSTPENGIIVNNTPRETVYLNATSGSDFNDGSTELIAVKTLNRAMKLLDKKATSPKIIVLSAYTLSSGEEGLLNRAGAIGNRVTIERGVATGDVIGISSGDMTISNITFDGKKGTYTSTGSLLKISGGTTTITDCTFSNNKTTDKGGGIYVDSGAVVTMTDGTISGNTATTGGGVYVDNMFNMSGTAQIPVGDGGKNDVYLPNGKYITITGNLTPPDGVTSVATITPANYVSEAVVVSGTTNLIASNYEKFAVTLENGNTTWLITSEGKLKLDKTGTISITIKLPSDYEFELTGISNNKVSVATPITAKVKKGGVELTTSVTICLMQFGDIVAQNANSLLTVPSVLGSLSGIYDIYVYVSISGKIYDTTISGITITP